MASKTREILEQVLREDSRHRRLCILLLDYIDLLSNELEETAIMAHERGWRSKRVEEGERLRAEIEKVAADK
jgi:hypothetical protein